MGDDLRVNINTVQNLKHVGQFRKKALSGYEASKEVDRQARNTKPMDEPAFRRALAKLDQTLDANKPLREDVPRGFYLNIRV
tara:strand:- start:229 stop:474 length:246 start_codon:yes stop_codon:yes gene_type:complete